MHFKRPLSFCSLLSCSLTLASAANEVPADPATQDKSRYNLFHPTPAGLMREMSTDRPDKTESPYTIDAGHFQMEMDLVSYTYDYEKRGGISTRIDAWAVAPVNLKVGLLNQLDLQLVLETWNDVQTQTSGRGQTRQQGFGDVASRLKYNLWGDDGGPTAFAVMPFIKLPTNQHRLGNDNVEGGLIFPLAVQLPHGFDMGLMTEIDFTRAVIAGDDYHPAFVNTITFGHALIGDFGGYVEFFSLVSPERGFDWVGTFDLGMTYGLTENIQLDAGINFGVTRSAPDLNPFLGLSWRF